MTDQRSRGIRRFVVLAMIVSVAALAYVGATRWHLGRAVIASWRGNWREVRRHAELHLDSYPQSRPAWRLLARSFVEAGDVASAERAYARMEQLEAATAADLNRLGGLYQSAGRPQQAIRAYQRALEVDPDHPAALLGLAAALDRQGGPADEIRELAGRATRLAPRRAEGWILLARAHLALAEAVPAAECLRKAVALDAPQNVQARKMLADVLLLFLNEPLEAEEQLQRARQAAPDDPQIAWMLAESYLRREPPQPQRAREHLDEALALDANNQRALLLLAGLLTGQGRGQEAEPYVNRALAIDPNDPQALHLERLCRQLQTGDTAPTPDQVAQALARQTPTRWRFVEAAEAMGVTFRHTSGENKQMRYYPETLGSGVAMFDYDGDGWMDLYFITSNFLAPDDPRRSTNPHNVLYRNLGDGRFQDVTAGSGLADTGFGHGASVGDYDNDGDPDVYVTNFGPNALYRNNGDGAFADVTATAGVADPGMSTSAAWFDYDEDGDLDLYVCNYAVYDVANPYDCTQPGIGRIYCGPDSMQSQRDTLYRNNGDGTFSDVTVEMGIARDGSSSPPSQEGAGGVSSETPVLGKGLGVIAADLNADGHVDLVVANDLTPNFLFAGDGRRLLDRSEASGIAANSDGQWESCMGIDAGDTDGDGDFDLFVTNQWMEKNTLYRNEGKLLFQDVSELCGLGYTTKRAVGWGTSLVDLDNDGDLDHFVTNGHFYDWRGDAQPFRQRSMLFENNGAGRFTDVGRSAGPYFDKLLVGRGAAFGDLDNDGDADIVVSHWDDRCEVLRNDLQPAGAWLRLELVGVTCNRDAVGAAIEVDAAGRRLVYQRKGGGSYLSSSDPRLLIGLGPAETVDRLRIRWPGGAVQEFENLKTRRSYRWVEGTFPEAQ